MSAHALVQYLMNLLNELRKRNKMRGLRSISGFTQASMSKIQGLFKDF